MFIKENMYLRNKVEIPSDTRLETKKKKVPDKRGGRGPLGPPLNPPLM